VEAVANRKALEPPLPAGVPAGALVERRLRGAWRQVRELAEIDWGLHFKLVLPAMLIGLGALLAALILWFGIVRPLDNALAEARARHGRAVLALADAKYMQVGFTAGGPIMRNKLFFFGDYVRTNDDSGRLTRDNVPEEAFRRGDFSSAPTRIYDPATGNPDGTGRTPFPNNQIPADRISPIARRLLNAIPLPNIPGAAPGAINFEQPYVREKRTNQGDIKLTYQLAANDLVSVRYSSQNARTKDPATFGIYGGLKPFAGTGTNPTQSLGVTYNRVWSATLVQEVRFGRTHHHNEAISEAHGLKTSDEFGIRGVGYDVDALITYD